MATSKDLIADAVEMTKDIPARDVLVPLQQPDEGDLAPYPKVEYDVLSDTSLSRLVKDVNRKLENGWYCNGGIQVTTGAAGTRYYQAMERRVATTDVVTLNIPGLENEPDLYEDIEPDAEQ